MQFVADGRAVLRARDKSRETAPFHMTCVARAAKGGGARYFAFLLFQMPSGTRAGQPRKVVGESEKALPR